MNRPQKITFRQMRRMAFAGCWSIARTTSAATRSAPIDGPIMSDYLTLNPLFMCQACGIKGADLRPDFKWHKTKESPVQNGAMPGRAFFQGRAKGSQRGEYGDR